MIPKHISIKVFKGAHHTGKRWKMGKKPSSIGLVRPNNEPMNKGKSALTVLKEMKTKNKKRKV